MKEINVKMTEEEYLTWKGCKAEQKFFEEELMTITGKYRITKQDYLLTDGTNIFAIEFKTKTTSSFKDYKTGFEGYGINKSQYESYLEIYKKFNIRCLLYIKDEKKNKYYIQWLDKLKNHIYIKNDSCNTKIFDIKEFVEADGVTWKRNMFSLIITFIEGKLE